MENSEDEVNQRCHCVLGVRCRIVQGLQNIFTTAETSFRTLKHPWKNLTDEDIRIVFRADLRLPGRLEERQKTPELNKPVIVNVEQDFNMRDIVLYKEQLELKYFLKQKYPTMLYSTRSYTGNGNMDIVLQLSRWTQTQVMQYEDRQHLPWISLFLR